MISRAAAAVAGAEGRLMGLETETLVVAGALLTAAIWLGLRLLALGTIPQGRKPSTAMAWLLLILTTPVLGLVLLRLFGGTRLERRRLERHTEVNQAIAGEVMLRGLEPLALTGVPPYVPTAVALNRRLGALPLSADNEVELFTQYRDSIDQMVAEVERARDFVHVEFYITAWDDLTGPLFDAMVAAAHRGVTVRLLFDHLGSRGIPGYRELLERLASAPIDAHPMLPIQPLRRHWRRPDLRNHRKIVVVDGQVAFMGSQNLTEPGYNKPGNHELGREWVDLMMRVRGPVVEAYDAVFLGDWYIETGERLRPKPGPPAPAVVDPVAAQVVPSGPGFATENNLRLFTTLVYGASRRLSLTSPYFVPDESLLYAVTTAAHRGVEVELFVSEVSDQFMVGHAQASYYRDLLEAGVRIYLYPAPFVLHAKHFTVDDDVAVIGSSNMDMRSFALNYEVSTMLLGAEVVGRFRAVEDAYRAVSHELTLQQWAQRSWRSRYLDSVMRLTSALQ